MNRWKKKGYKKHIKEKRPKIAKQTDATKK